MLLSTNEDTVDKEVGATDEDVLAAADALSEELAAVQAETEAFQFTSILMQCNEAISDEVGIDYGSACGAGGSC